MNRLEELLSAVFADEGDQTENDLFRALGERAASDEELLARMEDYFEYGE